MQLTTAYRNTLGLSYIYNCKIQSEISGGGQGLLDFLRTEKALHKASYQPTQFNTKENNSASLRNRSFFMNMQTDDKKNGLSYFAEWLMKPRGTDIFGNVFRNIHTIYDVALLQEIIKFNGVRNADRISSMIVGMYTFKELNLIITQQTRQKPTEFYNRLAFNGYSETGYGESISLDEMFD